MTDRFPDDELEALWGDQASQLTTPDTKEMTMNVQRHHQHEQRQLLLLNLREVAPALVLSGWFAWNGLQTTDRAWGYFGAALMSLAVGAFLVGTSLRQRRREQALDETTLSEIQRALSQAQHRAWLYRNIAWWYVLPLGIAIVLALAAQGRDFTSSGTITYLAVAAALGTAIHAFNRKVARDRYEPQVQRFSRLIADMT